MECMSPLSIFALSRFDMARTVQLRRALRLLLGHFLDCPSDFSSVASSEQSFSRFMNNVKYLHNTTPAYRGIVRHMSLGRKRSNVKNIYRRRHMSRDRIGGAGGRRNARPCRMQLKTVQFSDVPWKWFLERRYHWRRISKCSAMQWNCRIRTPKSPSRWEKERECLFWLSGPINVKCQCQKRL